MSNIQTEIINYLKIRSGGAEVSAEVLHKVIASLNHAERLVINAGYDNAAKVPDFKSMYLLITERAVNRCFDIINKRTTVVGKDIVLSSESSITELDLEYNTYRECLDIGITRLKDVTSDTMSKLSLKSIAEVSGSLVDVNQRYKLNLNY